MNAFFNNLSNFYDYCYYKDLEGIYCEKCKKWLIYGSPCGANTRDFLIVSDDLEPCPDCVKVRNGKYEFLSDFSGIREKFLTKKCKKFKVMYIEALRTPFLKKIPGRVFFKRDAITRKKALEIIDDDETYLEQGITLKNKFKNNYKQSDKRDLNEIIAHGVETRGVYFNRALLNRLKKCYEIEFSNHLGKFIVIKAFGTSEEKHNFYLKHINSNSNLEIINYIDENEFYEIGCELFKAEKESIKNEIILYEDYRFLQLIYNDNRDIYWRLHEYMITK